jgi:hypothetical protein
MTRDALDADNRMQDDLIALVAGTLDEPNFERVASAVAKDPALQQALKHLELIHAGMLRNAAPTDNAAAVAATTERVLNQIGAAAPASVDTGFTPAALRGLSNWLHTTWTSICQPDRARWAYGAVAAQTVVIVLLASNAMPWRSEETSAMRGAAGPTNSKQLGVVPGNVLFTVNFSANTPESAFRALLLDIEAEIVSGPNQLGQYRISVARNRSDLAQRKLNEAEFVQQFREMEP